MKYMNRSAFYWLLLGLCWTITIAVTLIENGLKFNVSILCYCVPAIGSYILAIIFQFKNKFNKGNNDE